MDKRYVHIIGWDKYQSYGNGVTGTARPNWIKVYTDLAEQPQYQALNMASRGLLLDLWLANARTNLHIPVEDVARICRVPGRKANLEPLIQAGFIKVSSRRPLDQSKRKKKSSPKSPQSGDLNDSTRGRRANGTSPRQVAEAEVSSRRKVYSEAKARATYKNLPADMREAWLAERSPEIQAAVLNGSGA